VLQCTDLLHDQLILINKINFILNLTLTDTQQNAVLSTAFIVHSHMPTKFNRNSSSILEVEI
jgi:hypothetical protein